jgi:transporter family-2 protein
MENISAAWLYPIILVAGALQAWGPPMNGVLKNSLTTPWLASLVSFLPIVALLGVLWFCLPRPLPTVEGISAMPWWAPLGVVVGAFAVIAGLLFVSKVGAGAFAGLTITANILMSLVIDHLVCLVSSSIRLAQDGRSAPCLWSAGSSPFQSSDRFGSGEPIRAFRIHLRKRGFDDGLTCSRESRRQR